MCEGTRCTHHRSAAVYVLERDYCHWIVCAGEPNGDGLASTYVSSASGYQLTRASGHSAAMFTIKFDEFDVRAFSDAYQVCDRCAEGGTHKCYGCEKTIMHMSSGWCENCRKARGWA